MPNLSAAQIKQCGRQVLARMKREAQAAQQLGERLNATARAVARIARQGLEVQRAKLTPLTASETARHLAAFASVIVG